MDKWLVLLIMVFCHIVDDYYLQATGALAQMKQRSWWEKEYPDRKYRHDYIIALAVHSFSWAFMVLFPTVIYMNWNPPALFLLLFFVNALVHGIVDHMKANLLIINLIVDQTIHMVQIVITYLILI